MSAAWRWCLPAFVISNTEESFILPTMDTKKIAFPVVASLALFALAGCYTNPVTGRQSLVLISAGEELQLGQQAFSEIRRTEKVSSDRAAMARVERGGHRIARAVGDQLPEAKWEFVVFDSPDVNAFALPGGKVGVYTGLLKLAESDDELAIVMGHEIGHVVARHGAERMSEAMVIAGVGVLGTAVVDNNADARTRDLFMIAYGGGATVLRVLPQSRRNESEADLMGLQFVAKAGYDPRASITFWQKMSAQKKGPRVPGWLSTHWPDAPRLAELKSAVPPFVPLYEANKGRADQENDP